MSDQVHDFRFILSDGTMVYIIYKGTPDDRHTQRLHESVDRLGMELGEQMVLRAHDAARVS